MTLPSSPHQIMMIISTTQSNEIANSTKFTTTSFTIFSERELTNYMLSPVHLSSVTFVRRTQAVQIFGNVCTALGTVAIR